MNKTFKLGSIAGLKLLAKPTVLPSILLVWLLYSLLGRKVFKLKPEQAILGGFLATLLHWFNEFWHNLGHAQAAKRTGYPMSGVCFVGPLGSSLYPPDEPTLPPHIHVRRALGGPIASGILALQGLPPRPKESPVLTFSGFQATEGLQNCIPLMP